MYNPQEKLTTMKFSAKYKRTDWPHVLHAALLALCVLAWPSATEAAVDAIGTLRALDRAALDAFALANPHGINTSHPYWRVPCREDTRLFEVRGILLESCLLC